MAHFEPTMRWFGPRDAVTLSQIRQAGATGVVTALHHLSPGDLWTVEAIREQQNLIEAAGMRWSVVESVPVHEDIKQQTGAWRTHLETYRQNLRNLAECGIRTVCYNYMAVTDWTRTDLGMPMPTGALALRFDRTDFALFDGFILEREGAEGDHAPETWNRAAQKFAQMPEEERERLTRTILLGLPGTVDDLSLDAFRDRLRAYAGWTADQLRESLIDFLREVIPVAEEVGVDLAIHPDDPPFPIFGLPRVAGTAEDLRELFSTVPNLANGLTYCTGSLGAHSGNDLLAIAREFGDRIHFLHLRSVRREEDGSFFEDDHLAGSQSLVPIVRELIALSDRTDRSLPMRPDHGHLIEGDDRRERTYPGYSYLGRLRGLAEIRGLELGLRASIAHA